MSDEIRAPKSGGGDTEEMIAGLEADGGMDWTVSVSPEQFILIKKSYAPVAERRLSPKERKLAPDTVTFETEKEMGEGEGSLYIAPTRDGVKTAEPIPVQFRKLHITEAFTVRGVFWRTKRQIAFILAGFGTPILRVTPRAQADDGSYSPELEEMLLTALEARNERLSIVPRLLDCAKCGKEFVTNRTDQLYCSPRCMEAGKKRQQRARLKSLK